MKLLEIIKKDVGNLFEDKEMKNSFILLGIVAVVLILSKITFVQPWLYLAGYIIAGIFITIVLIIFIVGITLYIRSILKRSKDED